MAAQKLTSASVRYKSRPVVRVVPFRDDTSLIAFRYEQTVQAAPPIPIIPVPPRNPARPSRPASSIVSATSPIVIFPPAPIPPREQHPALRARAESASIAEDWKRDSGLAPTSSTATIREECEQEPIYQKLDEEEREPERVSSYFCDAKSFTTANSQDTAVAHSTVEASVGSQRRTVSVEIPAHALFESPRTAPPSPPTAAYYPPSPTASAPASQQPSLSLSREASRRMARAFSLRPGPQAKKLKKKGAKTPDYSEVEVAPPPTPPKSAPPLPPKDGVYGRPNRAVDKDTGESTSDGRLGGPPSNRDPPSSKDEDPLPKARGSKPPKSQKWQLPLPGFGGGNKADPCRSQSADKLDSQNSGASPLGAFFPTITTAIPTDSLLEDDFLTQFSFSKRGSMMFGGKRAIVPSAAASAQAMEQGVAAADPYQGRPAIAGATETTGAAPSSVTTTATTSTTNPTSSPPTTSTAAPARASAMTTTTKTTTTPATDANDAKQDASTSTPRPPPVPPKTMMQVPDIRVLPVEVERESQKVRSLYESGSEVEWQDGRPGSSSSPGCSGDRLEPTAEVPSEGDEEEQNVASRSFSTSDNLSPPGRHATATTPRSHSSLSLRRDSPVQREFELAGGIEDWEDVDGADVDRYGFISPVPLRPASSTDASADTSGGNAPTRPSSSPASTTATATATAPRKRNVLIKRANPPTAEGQPSSSSLMPGRMPSRKVSARSLNTQTSELSTSSRRSTRSSIRAAANMLPHNRDRRWTDEAGEMLTLSPGLADIAEDEQVERLSEQFKRKEWERSEKWRKMAKVANKGQAGGGMEFEFDVRSPKVIDRTWKGIPDRWRAAAWYSFLAASARQAGYSVDEDASGLMSEFRRLQGVSSPDDTQIDLDVPRTINRHIMFRRRYRGGQRLLFRVLHALSLHFPGTGYVQGMASLAATLLCYYDEERTFVMLVRMWRHRGLERLYQPGFACLMAALRDLERYWLAGKDVARKLSELSIDSTAYATRWYLTLFNLSIPFQAQLRVWDVFMLLGEPSPMRPPKTAASSASASAVPAATATSGTTSTNTTTATATAESKEEQEREGPVPGFDVLHATGAALIHALREVLLDSDFENAMKALTSWIPIKDEELLMKVTRAEWKQRSGKGGGSGGGFGSGSRGKKAAAAAAA